MNKKINLLLLLAWVLAVNVYGQNRKIILRVVQSTSYPTTGKGTTGITANASLNAILNSMPNATYNPNYTAAYRVDAPSSWNYLKDYYAINNIDTMYNVDSIRNVIQNCASCGVAEVAVLSFRTQGYIPNDYNILTANDPGANWHLERIKAPDAWEISKSGPEIKIAIIDDGAFDITHQDFAGKVFYQDKAYYNNNGHGSWVASIAAGKTDDNQGVSAIGFDSKLMFFTYDGANSILQAALEGADVINLSMTGGQTPSQVEQSAINEAYNMGVFIVAGAGNGMLAGHPMEREDPDLIEYPGAYDHVFCVTGVQSNDVHKIEGPDIDQSHNHFTQVDLCAPAFHITHAMPYNGYDFGNGTSFAAPLVAGTVALIKHAFPCLSNDEIELILKESSDDIYGKGDNHLFLGKLGAGRLNAHEALKLAQTMSQGLVVTSNLYLTKSARYKSILIKKGATLSVSNCTLLMEDKGLITVEAGGSLVLSNSHIKSIPLNSKPGACGNNVPYKWLGIIVEGNPKLSQTRANQGYVNLISSSIEDAYNGISTMAKDANWNIDWSKSGGGIVCGSNSIFRNNGRHLEFTTYHSTTVGGVEINNQSTFTNTKFYVDDGRILTTGNKKLITIWDVKGVQFIGCTFENDYDKTIRTNKGTGILSVDASIIVQNNKNIIADRSVFKNLQYGIDATFFPSSPKAISINNTDFMSNLFGICIKEGFGGSIYRNRFNVGEVTFNSIPVGVQTIDASSFRVSENSYYSNLPDLILSNSSHGFGTEIRNSDKNSGTIPFTGSIYSHNSHSNINDATQLEYNNGFLQFKCNSFSNTGMAVKINPNSRSNSYARPSFGTCASDPIDRNNTFKHGALLSAYERDIFNLVNSSSNWKDLEYVIDPNLPDRPGNKSTYQSAQVDVTSCPNNIDKPKADLCNLIFDPEPFPNNGRYDVWDPTEKINNYEMLKQQIPHYPEENTPVDPSYTHKYTQLAILRSDIIYSYNQLILFDSENEVNHTNKLIHFLEKDETQESKKMLVAIYYNQNKLTEVNQYLQLILTNTMENYAFVEYYKLMTELRSQQKNIYQMNENQEALLRSLALSSTNIALSAQGVINLVYGEQVDYEPYLSLVDAENVNINNSDNNSDSLYSVEIHPNPLSKSASPILTISYAINTPFNTAVLKVQTQLGEILSSTNLYSAAGEVSLQSASIPQGLNIIQLYVNNLLVSTKNIILVE